MARTVEAAFDELLGRESLTANQILEAQIRINHLNNFLRSNLSLAGAPILTGSYARGTLCASERDIDILVPFSTSHYWARYQANSRNFLYWVRGYLNDHYKRSDVSSRQVAVRLDFLTFATEVTPGFHRQGEGYVIPNGTEGWLNTNPPFHARMMAEADVHHGGRLKPLVRLVKAWNLANGHRLSSFHVELMVESIKRWHAIGSWPTEVATVLHYMPSWLQSPFPDPWLSGGNVDDYLSADSRREVVKFVQDEAARAAQAEEYRRAGRIEAAFERWNMVIYKKFPAYG